MISTIFQLLGGGLFAVLDLRGALLYTSDALSALLRAPETAGAIGTDALQAHLHGRDGGALPWPLSPGEYPVQLVAAARGPLHLRLRVRALDEAGALYSFEVEAGHELLSLGNLFDQLPLLLLLVSVQGRVLYFNRLAQQYTGLSDLSADSLIGMDDRDYSALTGRSPAQATFRTARLRQALSTRRSVYWTERQQGPGEQDYRFLRLCYTPLLGHDGEPVLVLGHGQDITRETHDYLRAQLLSEAVQEGRDMVIVAELRQQLFDSPITLLNREAQRRLSHLNGRMDPGAPLLQQPLGELVRRFLTPEQQERLPLTVDSVVARAAQHGGAEVLLLELGRGTATERRFELVLSVIRPFDVMAELLFLADEHRTFGGVSYLVATLRDVTGRERRQRLEEGRARALQLSVSGAAPEQVLAELVAAAESQLPGMRGLVVLLRDGGLQLMAAGAATLPPDLERLDDPVGLALPLVKAARSGETVLHHFGGTGEDGGELESGGAGGMRTVWAVPICGLHGSGLGALALYCGAARQPQPGELETLRGLSRIAGLSVESWRAQDRLSKLAYLDPLTRLPNRHALMLALEAAVHGPALQQGEREPQGSSAAAPSATSAALPVMSADAAPTGAAAARGPDTGEVALGGLPAFQRRVAIGLLDLDGFRAVNERLGQVGGDRVLRQVAARLGEVAGQPEWRARQLQLARLGGDEFTLLLHPQGPGDIERLSGEVRRAIGAPLELGGQVLQLGSCVGWSLSPDLSMEPADLLVQADTAMYTARQQGQPWRLFSQHGEQWSLNPMTIRTALEGALERGELHLVYHPLIGRGSAGRGHGSGLLRGFEALLRWTHPEYGLIGPQEFIPVAEMSGLIRHIGGWVLRRALADARGWPAGTVVNVNISGRQFEHPDFLRSLQAALEENSFPPQRLTLELTESALLIGTSQVEAVLEGVRALGVRVALDDYGVGYSNLGRLRQMRLSSLKIDRSFTRDLLCPPTPPQRVSPEAAIIRSAVSLAHDLGLEVVVEGVETEEQWAAVQELGCDVGQGYLFSRPMLPEQAQMWLRDWETP